MWVHDEIINGRSLVDTINSENENIKYLPNVQLTSNVLAVADLDETCNDADVLVFVVPHQFLPGILIMS